MLKVDVHTHILPAELPRFRDRYGYGGFVGLEHSGACTARLVLDDGRSFREITHNAWDANVRLADCDRARVDVQVLSTVPVLFSYFAKPADGLDLARFLNDHLAGVVAAHPARFLGLGTLPMQAPGLAVRELERCVRDLHLSGVQIGSHVGDWNLDAAELFEVFAAAADLGAAVFVHPWDMMGQARMPKYFLPWLVGMPAETSLAICSMIFGGVFERLPRLRVLFAHGGGAFAGTFGRIQHGYDARPDLCSVDNARAPRDYLGRFFVDSLVHDGQMLRLLLELFGDDRVALGSDYPFPLGEAEPGRLIETLGLDESTRARLLGGNALAWLGTTAEAMGA